MTPSRSDRQLVQLGAMLRNARVEAGLTQNELGLHAGVSRQLVSRAESGSSRGEVGGLAKVAGALGYRLTIASKIPPADTQYRKTVKDLMERLNQEAHAAVENGSMR